MNNKGFTMMELIILVVTMLLLVACIYVAVYKPDTSITNIEDTTCQHVFVVSSEYNWWLEQYRTVTRCAKCGIVI